MAEDYFVRIDDVKHIEGQRLQVARRVLLSSAAYLTLKDIRVRKAQLTANLKIQMDSTAHLFHQLEGFLPHQELLSKKDISKPNEPKREKIVSPVSVSTHKMEKLQEALALIEKKIESLNL